MSVGRRPVAVVGIAIALAGTADVAAVAQDTTAFHELAAELAGVYALEAERHLVIVPHPSLGLLSLFDLETGLARPLEPVADTTGGTAPRQTYVYGPNVTAVSPVEGRIIFVRNEGGAVDRLVWSPDAGSEERRVARRVPLRREPVRFGNGDEAELAGWLITPPADGPHPVAVILQPGTNDRFGMWRTAMALAVDGIGVLVFDRRDAGESTGEELPSHYWSAAQVLAGDGAAAVRFARSHPRVDATRVGVVGWSGGGWLGALVARRVPELAFYVSIAGNSNPGWQQNRWNRLSTLRWEGIDPAAVDEAAAFLDDHYFALMHGETTWSEYQAAVRELEGRPWFDWMRETFGLWESQADALAYAELERDNVPEEDFARVSAPTLGLFFEHDESSPPETPWIFLRGRARGPNPDVTVRIFPNTTHEAFVVEEFPTEAGQSRIERLEPALFRELRRWVGEVVGAPAGSPHGSIAREVAAQEAGSWGPVLELPTHPEQMAVLPSGKVLMWPWAPDRRTPPHGPLALWDPADGSSTTYPGSGIESASGLAFEPDGTLLTAGGDMPRGGVDGNPRSFTFDHVTETLSEAASMAAGRVFPSATALSTGEILVTAGLDEDKEINGVPELWDGRRWTRLPGAFNDESRGPTFQFLAPDGRVFRAGPEELTDWLDVATGVWSDVAPEHRNEVRFQGTAVMYDEGKVLLAGGCREHDCHDVPAVATAEVIDLRNASPAWRAIAPMAFPRHSHHAILLPDGTVLVTGGTVRPGIFNDEAAGILEAELWDPDTERFTTVAPMDEPRHFQSTAVLLPDARVLVAGGAFGPSPDEARFAATGQVYSPSYLERGPRPTIAEAPPTIRYGQRFTIHTPDAAEVAQVTLIRLSASTQTWNGSQRLTRLAFTADSTGLEVETPRDRNLVPPGFYLLFVLDERGVPSVGQALRVHSEE